MYVQRVTQVTDYRLLWLRARRTVLAAIRTHARVVSLSSRLLGLVIRVTD